MIGKIILLILLVINDFWSISAGDAHAAWFSDPLVNNAISTAANDQHLPSIISDGSGGAIITWNDYRSSNSHIYAQRIDANGVVQWTADGVAICVAANYQDQPTIISDGFGGAIITWRDYRNDPSGNIYAQRINANGVAQWTVDGVAICLATSYQMNPTITRYFEDGDDASGTIITWLDYRKNLSGDIYGQRINMNGVVQWTTDGVPICASGGNPKNIAMIGSYDGGAFITWQDFRSNDKWDIYAQRINASGVVQWTADGVAICTAANSQDAPSITTDSQDGAIIIWNDRRSGNYDIYGQRINASGVVQWTANGVAICTAAHDQRSPTITKDGSGFVIITWEDGRNGNTDIYAQRIDAQSGVVQWTTNGVAICTAENIQQSFAITNDSNSGAIITWVDDRSGNRNIYAQRISVDGIAKWALDGVAISTAEHDKFFPAIISNSRNGAIITWQDTRSGNSDIYAQRINVDGTLTLPPTNYAISTAEGNQTSPNIISDGSGGTIITWKDDRNGNSDIYAQRINATGVIQWIPDGVVISAAGSNQESPAMISDGSGGAILTWYDYRSGNSSHIYAQRINADGVVQWTTDGVMVGNLGDLQVFPAIISDESGGAIITWVNGHNTIDIYAQRINANGVVQWAEGGVVVCTANVQGQPAIISDGSGGAIITWEDYRGHNFTNDIYAQRIDANGAVQWSLNGIAICTAANDQYSPSITSDGSGGAIITWYDYRSGSYNGGVIYAQRINASGIVQWTVDGIAICSGVNNNTINPTIISDGGGGVIITWAKNGNISAQRISADGIAKWALDGVAICSEAGGDWAPTITGDGSGGAIITWNDRRSGGSDIYAQRINANGVVQWTVDGVPISTVNSNNGYPAITSDGNGGAIVTWEDQRSGNSDIYAQRITANGTLIMLIEKGDVNGDGQVDLEDTILSLQILSGLATDNIHPTADLSGDGKIGMAEGIYAIRKAAGL